MTAFHDGRFTPMTLRYIADRLLSAAERAELANSCTPLPMPPSPAKKTMREVLLETVDTSGLTELALIGPCRAAAIFKVRAEAMRVMHDELGYSLPQIGRTFGGRDHTSVLSAVRRARTWKQLASG